MIEYLRGKDSFYYPYFAILPPPGTILNWTEDEIKELQDMYYFLNLVMHKDMLMNILKDYINFMINFLIKILVYHFIIQYLFI